MWRLLPLCLLSCTPSPADLDGDGVPATLDCDDARSTAFPGADELCNGRDDDCDHLIDETFDGDGDGFLSAVGSGCAALGEPLDCDDAEPAVHPDAVEQCNGLDDDCSGVIDDLRDRDRDGFTACEDCDDDDPTRRPDAEERCDGIDNDCSGLSDEGFDGDGDGWGDCLDCDDTSFVRYPGAAELCDGLDNDCDLDVDEDFDLDADGWAACRGDCDDAEPTVHTWAVEVCDGLDNDCSGFIDDVPDGDGDGWTTCDPLLPDCDDADPAVFPGAAEQCDGADNDCDGLTSPDELDLDGDGVRVCGGDCDDLDPARAAGFAQACGDVDHDCDPNTTGEGDLDGDGISPCEGDCDDRYADQRPGATERCNLDDDDCDGVIDEGAQCGACTPVALAGSVFLFCTDPRDWNMAETRCVGRGGHLASFADAVEHAAVAAEAANLSWDTWWIGLSDQATEDTWVWADGTPLSFANWNVGEPNDSGGEDCVELGAGGSPLWNDLPCWVELQYVCELPLRP